MRLQKMLRRIYVLSKLKIQYTEFVASAKWWWTTHIFDLINKSIIKACVIHSPGEKTMDMPINNKFLLVTYINDIYYVLLSTYWKNFPKEKQTRTCYSYLCMYIVILYGIMIVNTAKLNNKLLLLSKIW